MKYIDIHGHYAWDIDDGMPNKEDAYNALKLARLSNIETIIATPHIIPASHTIKDINEMKIRISELKLLANQFNIEIYQGCELFLNHDCINSIHNKEFIPFENTHYLLVEFDVRKELGTEDEVEDYLHEIEVIGYIPIIAHVERYFKNNLDLERVKELIDYGYVIQVNATSLLGIHGKKIKKNAYELLDNGLIHVIATDTHRCTGKRIPCLQEIYDILSKGYDYQVIKTLMYDNPLHIINNEPVENIIIKKSLLKNIFKRR